MQSMADSSLAQESVGHRPPSKFARVIHRHGRIKCLARSVYCCSIVDGRQSTVRLGTLCPVCGFSPNETARRWQRETIAKLRSGK